jgi:hypothetical protein
MVRNSKWLGLCCFLLLAGCNAPLKDERTLDLLGGEDKDVIIEATRWKQKIKVSVDSKEPVTVRIFLEKDLAAAESAIAEMKDSDVFLATEKGKTQITLEATIPAHEAVVIRVRNTTGMSTNVTVKTTN